MTTARQTTRTTTTALQATLPAVLPILGAALIAGEPLVNVVTTGVVVSVITFTLALLMTVIGSLGQNACIRK